MGYGIESIGLRFVETQGNASECVGVLGLVLVYCLNVILAYDIDIKAVGHIGDAGSRYGLHAVCVK